MQSFWVEGTNVSRLAPSLSSITRQIGSGREIRLRTGEILIHLSSTHGISDVAGASYIIYATPDLPGNGATARLRALENPLATHLTQERL